MVVHDNIDAKFEYFHYAATLMMKDNKTIEIDQDYRIFGIFSVLESLIPSSYTMRKIDVNNITDW